MIGSPVVERAQKINCNQRISNANKLHKYYQPNQGNFPDIDHFDYQILSIYQ